MYRRAVKTEVNIIYGQKKSLPCLWLGHLYECLNPSKQQLSWSWDLLLVQFPFLLGTVFQQLQILPSLGCYFLELSVLLEVLLLGSFLSICFCFFSFESLVTFESQLFWLHCGFSSLMHPLSYNFIHYLAFYFCCCSQNGSDILLWLTMS